MTISLAFWGGVAIVLSYSAYVAEVFRAGIESIHPSQRAASRALGLSHGQTLRHVVLPQAVRRVMPPLMNDFVSLQKDSGLIAVLGVTDAIQAARIETASDFNYTPYVVAGVLFICLTIPTARLTDHIAQEAGLARRGGRPVSDPATATALLSVRGLRKSFGANVVLDDVTLDIEPGQCVALIGASGSGKSTLLRCINLLEQVDDGVIELAGRDIADPRVDADQVRSRMGIVFQAYNLFPHLTVLDNVTLAPRRVHKVTRVAAESNAMTMLDRVGLADKAQARPDDLSGGQQQRVAIARAMVNSPELLLLDEVTSALDPELVGEVLDLLRDLRAEGMTHDPVDPRDGLRP